MENNGVNGKKILIVCGQEIILQRDDGGKKCCYRNFELFRQVYGEENVYLFMNSNMKETSDSHIRRLSAHKSKAHKVVNVLRGSFFMGKESEEEILRFVKVQNIDIVVFERSMFGNLIKKIKKETEAQTWVFVHNIEKNYFYNKVKYQSKLFWLPYLSVAKSEKIMMQYVDYIMTLTERDSKLLQEKYGRKSDVILPMTFNDGYERKIKEVKNIYKSGKEKNLLFIGSMFPPNYEGILWFVNNVMSQMPEWTLTIVGKDFETKSEELSRENVSVIGSVKELATYYLGENVMVMPILFGDGMKIKTAEAMMYGKVIFATHEALEGYDIEGVEHIYECNSAEDFVEKIQKFYPQNSEKFLAKDVRQCFLEKYEAQSIVKRFREFAEMNS